MGLAFFRCMAQVGTGNPRQAFEKRRDKANFNFFLELSSFDVETHSRISIPTPGYCIHSHPATRTLHSSIFCSCRDNL